MSCRSGYPPTEERQKCIGALDDKGRKDACKKYGDNWEYSNNNWGTCPIPGYAMPICEQTSWDSKYKSDCCLGTYNDAKRCQKDWCPKSASCSTIFEGVCSTTESGNTMIVQNGMYLSWSDGTGLHDTKDGLKWAVWTKNPSNRTNITIKDNKIYNIGLKMYLSQSGGKEYYDAPHGTFWAVWTKQPDALMRWTSITFKDNKISNTVLQSAGYAGFLGMVDKKNLPNYHGDENWAFWVRNPLPTEIRYPPVPFQSTRCQEQCDGRIRTDTWCKGAYQTWCTQQTTECPIDPNTGKKMPNCARLSSTGADGVICRNWQKRDPKAFDVAVGSYCAKNNTPDCACINRAQNPQYTEIKNNVIDALGFTGSAAPCWYFPCQDQTGVLMTLSQQQELKTCPNINICKEVVKMYNEGKINGDINIKQAIKCNFPNKPPPVSPEESPLPVTPVSPEESPLPVTPVDEESLLPLTPVEEIPTSPDGKKGTVVFVVVGIVVVVVILLLLLLLVLFL